MKNIVAIIVLVLFANTSFSQDKGSENVVGINHVINSSILKENRQIQVYLPKDYKTSNKKYPVIYLLDGQRFFLYGASLIQTFSELKLTPDFIVVGITQTNRRKDVSMEGKKMANFLKNDVVKLIDSTYRTLNKRLLFGWEWAGGSGIETLIAKSNLFDGYILSSPFPVSSKMKRFKSFIEENKNLNTFVYFVSDAKEFGVKEGTEELSDFLNKNTTNLRWTFKVLSGEEHESTAYPALYHGIKEYFENFNEVRFSDLQEFNLKGGLNFVNTYYTKRSNLYGFTKELEPYTKYHIISLAIRAKDYKQFHFLVTNFNTETLISQFYVNWLCNIADFYIKSQKKKEAFTFYKLISEKFPTSKRAQKAIEILKLDATKLLEK